MNRRSFLSLLAAAPILPQLAKLEHVLAPAAPVARAARASLLADPGSFARVMKYILPLAPVGGGAGVVRAGGVEIFSAMPQRPFRTERVMVPEHCAGFEILNVSAAGEPQFEESMPAEFFSPLAYGARLYFAPTAPGETIVMAVHNRTAHDTPFNVALVGCSVDDGPYVPPTPEQIDAEARELERRFQAGELDDDDDDEEGFPF